MRRVRPVHQLLIACVASILALAPQATAWASAITIDDITPRVRDMLRLKPEGFDASILALMLDMARLRKVQQVIIPPGIHRIDRPISISGAEGMVIDGQGATLVATFHDTVLHITNATKVTVKNLAIDYDPLPFTQGVVVDMDPNGKWYDIRIDQGYPQGDEILGPFKQYGVEMLVIDPKARALKPGTWDFRKAHRVEKTADNVMRLWFQQPKNPAVAVGDTAVLEYRLGKPALSLSGVKDSLFENVTIYSSPHIAILEQDGGGGNVYRNVRVAPGDPPAGAVRERLFSSNADAFHSGAMERGPVFENCFFELTGDDGINIKGRYVFVVGVVDNDLILAPRHIAKSIQAGDTLQLVDHNTLAVLGQARLTELAPFDDAGMKALARDLWENISGSRGAGNEPTAGLWRGKLDTALAAKVKPGDLAVSINRSGQGAIVRNTTIRGNRARGVYIKAPGVLIENNTFERNSLAGITIMPEPKWMEGPIPFDVVIRGNKITDSGVADTNYLAGLPYGGSAIAIVINGMSGVPQSSRDIKNVVIEDNVIHNPALASITVYNTTGLVIRNNVIRQGRGEMRIEYAGDVQLVNNTVDGALWELPSSQRQAAHYDDFAGDELDREKWSVPAAGIAVSGGRLELTARAGAKEASTEVTSTRTVAGDRFKIEANVVAVRDGQVFLGVRDKASRKLVRVVASSQYALHIDTTASGSFKRLFTAQRIIDWKNPITLGLERHGDTFNVYLNGTLVKSETIANFPTGEAEVFLQTWAAAGKEATGVWEWVAIGTGQ